MANMNTDQSNRINSSTSDFKNKNLNGEHMPDKMSHNAGEKVGSMASRFASSTADTMKSSKEYVKNNPMKGAAFAAALGLVTGGFLAILMRNRKDR